MNQGAFWTMSRCAAIATFVLLASLLPASTVRAQFGRHPFTPSQLADPLPAGGLAQGAPEPYMDLDTYLGQNSFPEDGPAFWTWQLLPDGLIYRSYLAGVKESRLSGQIVYEQDDGWLWESTVGERFGLFRWGTTDTNFPVGVQLDVEGSAQVRLDVVENVDVRSVDFRGGVPLTFGWGRHRTKFGYYHLSSHLGDEFLIRHPTYDRLNYSRDVLVLGHSVYLTPRMRIYGEAGWAFYSDVAKEWEFQFGLEHAPVGPTGPHGEPFFAANAHLREEVDFGGGLSVQTGWAWRGISGRMLRAGVQYYNGKSPQFSFYDDHEQTLGFALWYDR